MIPNELFFVLAAGMTVAAFLRLVYFTPDARIKRALRRARATTIAAAGDGQIVKIVGTVRYGQRTVKSPLTDRTCTLYSVVVDDTGRSPATEVVREDFGADFCVEDGSGLALVRIGDVAPTVVLVKDREFITTPIDSDAVIERFMTSRGHSLRGHLFLKSLRAREGVLEAGERVAVCGLARWMADPDAAGGSYRETPKRLVLEGSESLPLLLSDDPKTL